MIDNERTLICYWLAAGLLVAGLSLPLAHPLCVVGTSIGLSMLGVGIVLLVLRHLRR